MTAGSGYRATFTIYNTTRRISVLVEDVEDVTEQEVAASDEVQDGAAWPPRIRLRNGDSYFAEESFDEIVKTLARPLAVSADNARMIELKRTEGKPEWGMRTSVLASEVHTISETCHGTCVRMKDGEGILSMDSYEVIVALVAGHD